MPMRNSGGGSGSGRATNYDPVFGGRPAPVNVRDATDQAIAAALANYGDLTNLASRSNTFNQNQILDQLRTALPGYDNLVSKSSDVIQDHLAGLIPADVQAAIQNNAAARSVGGGYGGSGLAGNLVARDLGLTSLDLQKQGLQEMLNQVSNTRSTATGPLFDMSSFMVTPGLALDVQASNNAVAAAPDPRARAEYERSLFNQYYGMGMMGGGLPGGSIPAGGMPTIPGFNAAPAYQPIPVNNPAPVVGSGTARAPVSAPAAPSWYSGTAGPGDVPTFYNYTSGINPAPAPFPSASATLDAYYGL